ncbi:phage tail protein [Rhodoferax sp. U2-2l]|uniref:phage tail protein n=1 Tax=Rhodoferax sp. U2-2l TaxID=2884000 RepID=UPI001D0AB2A2|nr:phage tail protein [Rhodoferax sp. U2-2l]MCB8745473.1 phage tail protein [Rhodoferax sp. U2-2l]
MADLTRPGNDGFEAPLFGNRFVVAFTREPIAARGGGNDDRSSEALCQGAFSEVSGLEAAMAPKTIQEGGANYGAHQRAGQVSFATVVLKRGLTQASDLWHWWGLFAGARTDATRANGAFAHRLTVRITLLDLQSNPVLKWRLERAMPVKFKAADFNARSADVGIEEIHLVHEGLFIEAA